MKFTMRRLMTVGVLAAAMTAGTAQAQDDTNLFTTASPPNVVLMVDNSGSMKNIVWHPAYDPNTNYNCGACNCNGGVWVAAGTTSVDVTRCGKTRTFYGDPRLTTGSTSYTGNYAEWMFQLPDGDPILTEIADTANGSYSPCTQASQGLTTYSKYQRTRMTAAKDVLTEVICNVNAAGEVRFGMAQFRRSHGGEFHGGYLRVPIQDLDTPDYTLNGVGPQSHTQHLQDAIEALDPVTWTPLAETLFQVYTYFQSRNASETAFGDDGTRFTPYRYGTDAAPNGVPDGTYSPGNEPPDPVQNECQKHFVIVITDGEPTRDDFTDGGSTAQAQDFDDFDDLIGDYAPNYAGEGGENGQRWLDDVAFFMQNNDFRPDDVNGTQVIDVYTVGFTTNAAANAILTATAANGNGLFKQSNNAEELTTAITEAITDILIKSQAFSSATVPATRTAVGGNLYTSLFIPSADSPYWEGHMQLWNLTGAGEIHDKNGNCAFAGNPVPCLGGDFAATAVPFWDAGEEIPAPGARRLYTSIMDSRANFLHTLDGGPMTPLQLGDPVDPTDDLVVADIATYSGTVATTVDELSREIIWNVRGCVFGQVGGACLQRPWLLGDIFHSNPVLAEEPGLSLTEPSYIQFKITYGTRKRVVFAGSNDGWVHGFNAGEYQAVPTPGYDRGTGEELFGFMPWPVRQAIREIPRDTGARDYYGVDGSPTVADAWIDSDGNEQKASDGSEWRTVLLGGLRQGGHAYYALDVTDPGLGAGPVPPSYPGYLWEYPRESDPQAIKDQFGQTWGRPVVTRVRVEISGKPHERWVAIVTGGYHPSGDPNDMVNYDPAQVAGRGIYIIDLKTGQLLGEKKFGGPTAEESDMLYAIPSTPSVFDLDFDGYADVIYVGDLGGNMWKWVLRYDKFAATPNVLSDPVNDVLGQESQPNTKFVKFFEVPPATVSAVTYSKSFFYPPAGALKSGRLWVAFGSGERADLKRPGDTGSTADDNRFYSMIDHDPYERQAPTVFTEADLYDASNDGYCTPPGPNGYFFRAEDHEKFVTNAALFNFWILVGSFKPEIPVVDPCNATGEAAIYAFRIYCGDGLFAETGAGQDRKYDMGTGVPTDPKISVGPGGPRVIVDKRPPPPPPDMPEDPVGQLFWQEPNQ